MRCTQAWPVPLVGSTPSWAYVSTVYRAPEAETSAPCAMSGDGRSSLHTAWQVVCGKGEDEGEGEGKGKGEGEDNISSP